MIKHLLLLTSFFSLFLLDLRACHETTVSETSATDNGDGTITYLLDVCVGSEDTWGFELSFATNGSIVSVNTASITDAGTGVTITPTITSSTTLEFGDFDNTGNPIFHALGSGQACFPVSVTLSGTTTDVTVDGAEFIFGPCSGTAALRSCFVGNSDYVIEITSDNCTGNNISFELQDNTGTAIAGLTNILTDGNTRTYLWCGGCATFFEINAPASSGGSPSGRCDPGLCCVEGNGGYSVTTGGGSLLLVSSSMTNVSTETTNIAACDPLLSSNLTHFSANKKGQKVAINWAAENIEADTKYEVQKSEDGIHFENLISLNQADAVSHEKYFMIEDFYPREGVNYYRIRYRGPDNVLFYSEVVSINMVFSMDLDAVQIFPNPANDAFQFLYEFPSDQHIALELVIFDLMGNPIKKLSYKDFHPGYVQSVNVPVADLANGVYLVQISTGTSKTTRKLTIVK